MKFAAGMLVEIALTIALAAAWFWDTVGNLGQ